MIFAFRPPTPPPSFVQIFHPVNMRAALNTHKAVRRLPSAPAGHNQAHSVLPVHELFRGAYRGSFYGGDIVASDCGKCELELERLGRELPLSRDPVGLDRRRWWRSC